MSRDALDRVKLSWNGGYSLGETFSLKRYSWHWEFAIGLWAFLHTELTAMIYLSDHQTITFQWAIRNRQRYLY